MNSLYLYYTELTLEEAKHNNDLDLENPQKTLLFRGQTDSTWDLETSLDRFLERIDPLDQHTVEPFLIEEFQRRYRNYLQNTPKFNNRIEWWALMQHYGCPTRLLDWTYSSFIALFFALEDIENPKESALWAIDADWLGKKYREDYPDLASSLSSDPHMSRLSTFKKFDGKPIVLRLNPFLLHERLSVQQGCFLIPGDASKSFVKNLIDFSGGEDILKKNLFKIKIPHAQEKQRERLEGLMRKNISRASLFPDIGGYAQSLRTLTYSMPKLLRKPEFRERINNSWAWKTQTPWTDTN